jgi:hypothetical protein
VSRSRNIKPGLFRNEVLGQADPLLTILFQSLWCIADREGILEDRPLRIKADTFPYREIRDMDGMLQWLHDQGFIVRYSVGGKRLIQVVEFSRHQNPHKNEKPSEYQPYTTGSENIGTNPDKIGSARADSFNLIPDSNKEPAPKGASRGTSLETWLESLGDQEAIPADDPIFDYAAKAGIPLDFLELSWKRFCEDMAERNKRQKDWRAHYRNAVRGNWYKIWWQDSDGNYQLTTQGKQAKAVLA